MQNISCPNGNLDVTIVIVSYNTREMTVECIQSILTQTTFIHYEVIVVDNGSTDRSAEAIRTNFPNVKLIASLENSDLQARTILLQCMLGGDDFFCSIRTPSF